MQIVSKELSYTYNPKSQFYKQALKDISLTINEGDFFGIIGQTGSGKSTFIQHLNGLIPVQSGSLTVGDFDLSLKNKKDKKKMYNLRSKVGMVFQYPESQLFAETVFEDVAFGLKNFKPNATEKEVCLAVKEALETVGLSYEGLARLYGYMDKSKNLAPPNYPEVAKGTDVPKENVPYVDELYVQYYDYMLDNRICSYYLPYDVLDDRADKYMSDPRVTTFRVFDGYSDEDLIRVAEKFKDHPEWKKKAYFYPLDEPLNKNDFERLMTMVERLNRLCPGIRCLSPFFRDIPLLPDKDSLQVMLENLGHMVPKICCFNDDFIYRHPGLNRAALEPFQTRLERARDEKGIKYWQYVCWEPGKPYVNLYLNEPGLDHRLLFWMQHKVGANGFLYWRSNFWAYVDPFEDMATVPMLNKHVFGDGSLVYNGNHIGIDGPCGSIRLEAVRDGLEDCEMLNMADAVLGREWVLEQINTIVKSVTEYTDSVDLFNTVRNTIAEALEEALNDK